jgi:hypothetical protein
VVFFFEPRFPDDEVRDDDVRVVFAEDPFVLLCGLWDAGFLLAALVEVSALELWPAAAATPTTSASAPMAIDRAQRV